MGRVRNTAPSGHLTRIMEALGLERLEGEVGWMTMEDVGRSDWPWFCDEVPPSMLQGPDYPTARFRDIQVATIFGDPTEALPIRAEGFYTVFRHPWRVVCFTSYVIDPLLAVGEGQVEIRPVLEIYYEVGNVMTPEAWEKTLPREVT